MRHASPGRCKENSILRALGGRRGERMGLLHGVRGKPDSWLSHYQRLLEPPHHDDPSKENRGHGQMVEKSGNLSYAFRILKMGKETGRHGLDGKEIPKQFQWQAEILGRGLVKRKEFIEITKTQIEDNFKKQKFFTPTIKKEFMEPVST